MVAPLRCVRSFAYEQIYINNSPMLLHQSECECIYSVITTLGALHLFVTSRASTYLYFALIIISEEYQMQYIVQ